MDLLQNGAAKERDSTSLRDHDQIDIPREGNFARRQA